MSDPKYLYMVNLVVDVKRTDNQMLTDHENEMVLEMHKAAEKAVAEIMKEHGMNNQKHLGKKVNKY